MVYPTTTNNISQKIGPSFTIGLPFGNIGLLQFYYYPVYQLLGSFIETGANWGEIFYSGAPNPDRNHHICCNG
jgi:hypothetical protein